MLIFVCIYFIPLQIKRLIRNTLYPNFKYIEYLKSGNKKQQLAYKVLSENRIITILQEFSPTLVGTIPINIDIKNSDIDIICNYVNQDKFINTLHSNFSNNTNYLLRKEIIKGQESIIANFIVDTFEIEIFGQTTPIDNQYAYRHMLIEYELLNKYGEDFRQKIISLKKQGYKTEPAFAIVLGLKGDPYESLLTYKD